MKIRLAKKIWNGAINKTYPYWLDKFVKADKLDRRITQSSRTLVKWKSNNLKNRLKKYVRITPFQAKEIRRSVELLNCSLSDCVNASKQRFKKDTYGRRKMLR